MKSVFDSFGRLDILASNAGVEHFGNWKTSQTKIFRRVFDTNVGGQLFATKAAVKYMNSGGAIVLTSSVSARIAVYHHTLYAATKAAVSAMVLNLAPELSEKQIRINAIAPGGTATSMAEKYGHSYTHPALTSLPQELVIKSMTSLQRLADPEEIAAAVVVLVSGDASYITGTTLHVDGGWI